MRWGTALCVNVLLFCASHASAQPYTFHEMAREFVGGFGWLEPDLPPAIARDGTVVFGGSPLGSFESESPLLLISTGDPTALTIVDLDAAGYTMPQNVQVDGRGRVVFNSSRIVKGVLHRGLYRTSVTGAPIAVVYEDTTLPAWFQYFGLSPNGTYAFSTIVSAAGAVMRGVLPNPPSVIRSGSGVFYNNRRVDVNDRGEVAVEMEYTDPTMGLGRGILLFTEPEQALTDIETAIEKLGVGFDGHNFAVNRAGVVVFSTNFSHTLRFYDPPHEWSPTPSETIVLTPGVYKAEPSPFGEPSVLTKIADAKGAYKTFGRVSINDAGVVVFEASLDEPYMFGIYRGPDPVADKIVQQGDVVDGALFSWIRMGEINNAGQLTFLTSDYYSTDRQVWRVGNIKPKRAPLVPPKLPLLPKLPVRVPLPKPSPLR